MGDIWLYLGLGLGIGVLSGFFGIGGGFILTPILLLLSFSPVVAIATSLLYTVGTSLSGTFAHYRLHHINWKPGLIIGFSGIIGSQIARPFVLFLEHLQIENITIPSIYILLIIYLSFSLISKKSLLFMPSKITPKVNQDINKWVFIVIGLFAGFISATLGVGGGFVIVPLLISFAAYKPREAVGTGIFSVLMIVIAGFTSYAFSTPINYETCGYLIIGAMIGGQLGALVTRNYQDQKIQTFLAGLYIATGISLTLKLLNLDFYGLLILSIYCVYLLIHFVVHSVKRFFPKQKHVFVKK
ncbi:sulfite exporter TauE/SafE family protein [Litchfieldia alkalitelluris]|uniref:sulfite exporter TauE/SafE family protein n=1 Tax=Litchfieldia alkalitelluris TaxID=304268 RepID=UPI0009982D00|nr:sulfite exporter TauE/SafE family protein [Litchfieldia alkalitelluris]